MTTEEAFKQLIGQRAWYKTVGLTPEAAWSIAKRFRDGESISTEKIEGILEKAGYKVVVEKQWAGVEPTSEMQFLMDIPEDQYKAIGNWIELHSHMFPDDCDFMQRVQMADVYFKKLREKGESEPSVDYKVLLEKYLAHVKQNEKEGFLDIVSLVHSNFPFTETEIYTLNDLFPPDPDHY